MNMPHFTEDLTAHIKARYALIAISTHEDERTAGIIGDISKALGARLFFWSHSRGLVEPLSSENQIKTTDLKVALDRCEDICKSSDTPYLFVFYDVANFLGPNTNPIYRRRLRDFAQSIRQQGYRANCILLSPEFSLSTELQKEVVIIDLPLPTRLEVRDFLRTYCEQWRDHPGISIKLDPEADNAIIDACLGLTMNEIENSLSRCLVMQRTLSMEQVPIIVREKKQIARHNGILEFVDSSDGVESVGGLSCLKNWLSVRKRCFSDEAKAYGIKNPKGVLLVGVPGCGKSLVAKTVSNSWSMPLIRLDLSKIYQGIVGASESNIRSSLNTAAILSPCVLWIDEIDKGLSGSANGSLDGGTATRVFGTILTWMQENSSPVFVFATANDISMLPPELLRKGRFDEIFFIDLPNETERKEIISIHLKKVGRSLIDFDLDLLARECGPSRFGEGICLTGAEIEAWIQASLIISFSSSTHDGSFQKRDLDMKCLIDTLGSLVPLSKQRSNDFVALRSWANENAVSASTLPDQKISYVEDNALNEFGAGRRLDI